MFLGAAIGAGLINVVGGAVALLAAAAIFAAGTLTLVLTSRSR